MYYAAYRDDDFAVQVLHLLEEKMKHRMPAEILVLGKGARPPRESVLLLTFDTSLRNSHFIRVIHPESDPTLVGKIPLHAKDARWHVALWKNSFGGRFKKKVQRLPHTIEWLNGVRFAA